MTATRRRLDFRAVNRRGEAGYDPALQRHHILPRQLLACRCFAPLLEAAGPERVGFDDFRRNGMLLPARGEAAVRLALPLHRGPHREYSEMVIERVGTIDADWARERLRRPERAIEAALAQLASLQRSLRRELMDSRRRMVLSRKDPLGAGYDFTALDAMAEQLWTQTHTIADSSDSFAA